MKINFKPLLNVHESQVLHCSSLADVLVVPCRAACLKIFGHLLAHFVIFGAFEKWGDDGGGAHLDGKCVCLCYLPLHHKVWHWLTWVIPEKRTIKWLWWRQIATVSTVDVASIFGKSRQHQFCFSLELMDI